MIELLSILVPIALIDSTSMVSLGILPLVNMLAGPRSYETAWSFILGLFVSYLVMGLAFMFGLSSVFEPLNEWLEYRWHNPEPADFGLELLLGLVMVVAGGRIAERRREQQEKKSTRSGMGPAAAFGLGFMINVVGFPGALPFFAAADQILRADMVGLDIVLVVAFYVAVFVLPLVLLVALQRLLGARGTALMNRIKGFMDIWGRRAFVVLLVGLGALMVVDAGLYFLRGVPLLPT